MNVGVVAIGRNEGERLRACLTSARRDCPSVVYVDSGSMDESVKLAKSLGVHVVELDLSKPFTAARARNEGFRRLLHIDSSIDAVQFVDGDCEIVAGWIAAASTELEANSKAGVICGQRRERFPHASIYNRLCDMEWNTPVGQAIACGGDALIRVAAFSEVQGYNAEVIAGEEPEMCVRLRERGWTIHRIDVEMTIHDAAMTKISQWWTRNVRSGHAYAQGNAIHAAFRKREVRSIEFWAIWPVIAAVVLTVSIGILQSWWFWIGLLPLLMYPAFVGKIAVNRRARGEGFEDALLYAVAVVLGKFPQHLGIRTFRRGRRIGKASLIIEHKGPVSRSKQLVVPGGHDAG
jgi:glycosyltransferase involved in cell wall biosynthesis